MKTTFVLSVVLTAPVLFMVPNTVFGQDTGSVFIGDLGNPEKSNSESVKTKVTKSDGTSVTIESFPQINDADTSQQKATKVADSINSDDQNTNGSGGKLAKATATGHTVSVVGQGGANVTDINMSNNTREGSHTFKEHKPPQIPEEGGGGYFPPTLVFARAALAIGAVFQQPVFRGYVTFGGSIAGQDPSGNTSSVNVGTARYVSVKNPGNYATIEALVDALVADLQAHGVTATKLSASRLRINFGFLDQSTLYWGGDDDLLDMTGQIGYNDPF